MYKERLTLSSDLEGRNNNKKKKTGHPKDQKYNVAASQIRVGRQFFLCIM